MCSDIVFEGVSLLAGILLQWWLSLPIIIVCNEKIWSYCNIQCGHILVSSSSCLGYRIDPNRHSLAGHYVCKSSKFCNSSSTTGCNLMTPRMWCYTGW